MANEDKYPKQVGKEIPVAEAHKEMAACIGKGAYLFVYKTVIPAHSYFFHTLRG